MADFDVNNKVCFGLGLDCVFDEFDEGEAKYHSGPLYGLKLCTKNLLKTCKSSLAQLKVINLLK